MPDIIKLLPDSVANQIAAGEVIQRPASVVKELVENSVDAGAKNIKVIIRDAGKTTIQVTDDGMGMSGTDARLAFERHATSKITDAKDLFAIRTKGFRGEALASIAAVSMVELRTRRQNEETGTHIVISGSKVEKQDICSCPAGSDFAVKNLFFNIPARRKFLKSDNTEIRHIINEFQKVALAHYTIRFSLYHNDTEIYNLPESNLRQRIVNVFGRQINQDLISVDTETSLIRITGFIGKPENARRTMGEQFFFVNSRYMRHPYFHKAVMEAYQNILPADAVPSYFIFTEVNPEKIDINIHPTKTEIKFEDERAIWQIMMASVRESLGRFNVVPSLDFENEALVDIPVLNGKEELPAPPGIEVNPGYNPFDGDEPSRRDSFIDRFERDRNKGWDKLYYENTERKPAEHIPEAVADQQRKIFQIKSKYIVCPVISGLMVIDQKRAHERILYERYLNNLTGNDPSSQITLFPETVELNPADIFTLKEIENDLRLLGMDIRELGNNTISINSLPSGAEGSDPKEVLALFLGEFRNKQTDPSEGMKGRVASSLARASAIPYGKALTRTEMEELFDTLFACASPNYSPSGKPVIQIIALEELDKKFK
ncbi:MAG TPA: DNA mismatch repair endonuclease MutL [Bacteroidales bacterium]|nr:DNA mismatch repair endonuclease MutL [Bacteroidales bacterium]